MTDKSFGDHTNRNIVKNPLLSTAVTGLCIEDLTHNAVLLPAAPTLGPITRSEQPGTQASTLEHSGYETTNFPSGDAHPNISNQLTPPTNYPSILDNKKIEHYDNSKEIPVSTVSKASLKSEDEFDVNEYFARLQSTRYVSAPINSHLKEDNNANLEATEENLEEINLNEPEKTQNVNEFQQSLTADIAQNFSQLPTVLPQVASAVFSSFSNMLNLKSRDHTVDDAKMHVGNQEVQFHTTESVAVPLMGVDDQTTVREVAPPPKEPPTIGTGNYRITTKKKAYAQIPGLTGDSAQYMTFPSQNEPHFTPIIESQYTQIQKLEPFMDAPRAEPSQNTANVQDYNIFNPVAFDGPENKAVSSEKEYNILNPVSFDSTEQKTHASENQPNFFAVPKDSKSVFHSTVGVPEPTASQDIAPPPVQTQGPSTPIIPPPPMFSNLPRRDSQTGIGKTILPPSVARRISANQPIIKPQTVQPPNLTENIFVPKMLPDTSPEISHAQSQIIGQTSVPAQDLSKPDLLFQRPPASPATNMSVPLNTIQPPPTLANTSISSSIPPANIPFKSAISSETSLSMLPPSISSHKSAPEYGIPSSDNVNIHYPPSVTRNPSVLTLSTELTLPVQSPACQPNIASPPTFYNPSLIQPSNAAEVAPITETIQKSHSSHFQDVAQFTESKPPETKVIEPPKVLGSVNYRMTKKRPQYYSGPIEGVGTISNNVKPVIPAANTSSFQGALFTPEQTHAVGQVMAPAIEQSAVPFDLTQPTSSVVGYTPFDISNPQSQIDSNTAFDLSRPTTESYDEPKQESKGFGIIGSLKSKLSSLDMNKIQSKVTTFFDPAYNEGRKEASSHQENVSYGPPNQLHHQNQNQGGFEIFVPSVETQQHQQINDYPSKQNTYFSQNTTSYQTHDQFSYYQNPTQSLYPTSSYYSTSYGDSTPQSNTAISDNTGAPFHVAAIDTRDSQVTTVQPSFLNTLKKTETAEMNYSQENVEPSKNIDSNDFGSIYKVIDNIYTQEIITNAPETAKQVIGSDPNSDRNLSTKLFENIASNEHDVSAKTFFDDPQPINLFQSAIKPEYEQNVANLHISQDLIRKEVKPEIKDSDLKTYKSAEDQNKVPEDIHVSDGNKPVLFTHEIDKNILDSMTFLNKETVVQEPKETTLIESLTKDDIPVVGVSTVPLFGLSAILADKSKEMTDLENNIKNVSLFEADSMYDKNASMSFFQNFDEAKTADNYKVNDSVTNRNEMNIYESCRKLQEPEEVESDDFTAQLIENIMAPLQLSNPVEVPFIESSTTENRVEFDSKQNEEISHISEETIETIQVQSATELLDGVKTNYGWSMEDNYVPSDTLLDHDYSFQVNPNSTGLFGSNPLFFDDVPNNASDEIKAELKSSHEDVILPRQMSTPSAPAEDDNKSDETGGLDVHSIEQDANKDFPVYEEFVIEPSETDDDKIEREKSTEDSGQEVDTFADRVEKFKKMEESQEDLDEHKLHMFDMATKNSPAISIASYFDTGNYAADTHYRNSISSPSALTSLNVGSTNLPMRIPPGFEAEYQRRLSGFIDYEENTKPMIPDTTTQTPTTSTAVFTQAQKPNTEREKITSLSELIDRQKLQETESMESPDISNVIEAKKTEFMTIFSQKTESKNEESLNPVAFDDSSFFASTKSEDVKKGIQSTEEQNSCTATETSNQAIPQSLPDPINFFSPNEPLESNVPENSFNRLASYFTSPPKADTAKSFFELSQSQNHYRHDSSQDVDSYKELGQIHNANDRNIPQNIYLTNLMKDLTSPENIEIKSVEQIVRTVNYFTIEYDIKDSNIAGTVNGKTTGSEKNVDSIGFEKKLELEETESDDDHFEFIINNTEYCCNNFAFSNILAGIGSKDYKIRKASDSCDDRKGGSMDQGKDKDRRSVTVNFDGYEMHEETNEGVSVLSENRGTTDYTPVKHHWFYRVDVEEKSIWRGFSVIDSAALEAAFNSPDLNENTLVPTDGGRYDVNVVGRLRMPIYWNDKPTNVRRCSWFYKGTTYVPYTEDIAEKLEEEYRHGMTTGEWRRRLILPNNEMVVMHGPSVMVHFLHSGASDAFSSPAQATSRPRIVRRGHDESEIEDSEASSIDHLLFMCHGVGSACDMRFRPIEKVVDDFRSTSTQLLQSHYRNSCDDGVVSRVEALPISWHSTLHSGEMGVDRRLAQITLDSIPMLRNFTNDTVLDVLFYTSPVYCQTIIDTVCKEMNRIYKIFMKRNPGFKGGVSLVGHSLGSVILYDLLCHQDPQSSKSPEKRYINGPAGTGQPTVRYPPLDFLPDTLFALGSPIAIFECIRGVEALGKDFALPTCKNFLNIFHPHDPIAYRIEPLINYQLKDVKPYLIPHHKGRKRMHLELKETMSRVGADLKQKLIESLRSTWNKWKSLPTPTDGQLEKVVEEELEKEQLCEEGKDDSSQSSDVATPEMLGNLNKGRRVDYVLQEAPLEMINEYLFAMRSHVGYWDSEDTILLVLKEIYDGLGVLPDSTVPQQSLTVERTRANNEDETVPTNSADFPSTSRNVT